MGGKSSRFGLGIDPCRDDVVYKLKADSDSEDLDEAPLFHDYRMQLGFACYSVLVNILNDRDVVSVIISSLMAMIPIRDRLDFDNSSSVYFDIGNDIYVCGNSVYGPKFQPDLYSAETNKTFQKLRIGNVLQLACGDNHMLVLFAGSEEEGGGLYANGKNSEGQLGLGDTVDRIQLVKIPFFSNGKHGSVISIHCGYTFSIVWTTTGLYSFGCNSYGQIGLKNPAIDPNLSEEESYMKGQYGAFFVLPEDMLAQTPEIRSSSIRSVFTSVWNSMILLQDGTLRACGDNRGGQLGLGHRDERVSKLENVLLKDVLHASMGNGWSIFQTADGLYSCGDISWGACGHDYNYDMPRDETKLSIPKKIDFNHKVKALRTGKHHTVVLTETGDLYTCGDNRNYELGIGATTECYIHTFTKISKLSNVESIQCGSDCTIAKTADGKMYYWGFTWIGTRESHPTEYAQYETLMKELQLKREQAQKRRKAKPVRPTKEAPESMPEKETTIAAEQSTPSSPRRPKKGAPEGTVSRQSSGKK